MHKLIWPRDLSKAARWYLFVLQKSLKGLSLDEFIELLQASDASIDLERRTVQAQLSRLIDAALVERSSFKASTAYSITKTGIERLELIQFRNIEIPPGYDWDRHWRLVIFDIPETLREARYYIRKLLKDLGFSQMQLSVWIHPLPCLEKFHEIIDAYGLPAHVYLIETHNFNPNLKIISQFQKMYPTLKLK